MTPLDLGTQEEPKEIRVLVVDDSAFMRYTITEHINKASGMRVIGAARDGQEAIEMTAQLKPDVITMDVEMPKLDGISALKQIMAQKPLPVIMLSSLTTDGAKETVQALTLGAYDFVAKPSNKANVAAVMDEVISKVRSAVSAKVSPFPIRPSILARPVVAESVASGATPTKIMRPMTKTDKVLVIGSSTGGPRALHAVVPLIAANLPAAILIVQHMPAGFTRSLAERLDSVSSLRVKEAEAGDTLEVGKALLAPGGYHMVVDENRQIALNKNPTVHGVRPAIDVTISSVVQHFGGQTVGVILTGMGRDGTNGCMLIHSSGGKVIAEDESTCVVWGMPRSVFEAGVADQVAPIDEVARSIEQMIRSSRV